MLSADILIMDLDGTLVDSQLDIAQAVNETLDHFGQPPLELVAIKPYVGTGVRPLLELEIVQKMGRPLDELVRVFMERYRANLLGHTYLYEGVKEALEHFRGKKKVVLTNKETTFVPPIIEGLGIHKHFLGLYGRSSFKTHKPSPEPILEICRIHGSSPERALMIGDTIVDVGAGRAAGAQTCAFLFGYGKRDDLERAQPDLILGSWSELKDHVS